MKPKNLQQRIIIFVLIPVFFILSGMGWVTFIYTRNAIIKQWSETAIAKLQKASHLIDMRLSKTKDLLLMLKNDTSQSFIVQEFIINQLKNTEGVVEVNYDVPKNFHRAANHGRMPLRQMKGMHETLGEEFHFTLPKYNTLLNSEIISLSTDFIDKNGKVAGRIEVVISFQDLIEQISKTNWWKSHNAFIIDNEGNILIRTQKMENNNNADRLVKFAQTDPLEKLTLAALSKNRYGTVFGSGRPPEEISGYYHLNEAPWSLVLISPGKQVLKPILNFIIFYFVSGFLSIISVILFIRITINGTTKAIKKVSKAAKNLADGLFGEQLPVIYKDEVGELTYNFNRMTKQLKERVELKEAMNLAKKVQQSLLPPANASYKNLEISGRSVYCDETGGDFFDIIEFPNHPKKICVAVGDVVGHGVSAALLMATTRALLRGRITHGGSLSQVINDVNRLLCIDTYESGSFVSLFLFMIDVEKKELRWIRAGHDPAIVYHPDKNSLIALSGDGLVLGLDENFWYDENVFVNIQEGTVVLIGTDGVWEDKDNSGEHFGKKRLENVLQQSNILSSKEIVNKIISDGKKFRSKAKQMDDITLLVLKFL